MSWFAKIILKEGANPQNAAEPYPKSNPKPQFRLDGHYNSQLLTKLDRVCHLLLNSEQRVQDIGVAKGDRNIVWESATHNQLL